MLELMKYCWFKSQTFWKKKKPEQRKRIIIGVKTRLQLSPSQIRSRCLSLGFDTVIHVQFRVELDSAFISQPCVFESLHTDLLFSSL